MQRRIYNNSIPSGEYIMVEHKKKKHSNICCGTPYVLPIASHITLGGIKVGNGLEIDENGVLSVTSGGGGTVNNGLLKISTTGVATGGGFFTANQAGNTNIVINVPNTLSSYLNDIGFLTTETDPTVPLHVKGITLYDINLWNTVGISSDAGNVLTLGTDGKVYYNYIPVVPNDGLFTVNTTGIATGSGSFSANQSTNSTVTIDVPGTNLGGSLTGSSLTITSSTGTPATIDLSPIIPAPVTVNDGILNISGGGIATGSGIFSANQATNSSIIINVPGTDISSSLSGNILSINSSTGTDTTIDLSPILPTVNNSTITFTAGLGLSGGGSFTLNQAVGGVVSYNLNATLSDLLDVNIPSASTNDLLRFNGSQWTSWTPDFLSAVPNLQQVTDVGNITNKPLIHDYASNLRVIKNPAGVHYFSGASSGCIVIAHPIVTGATFVEINVTVGGYQSTNTRSIKYNIKCYLTGGSVNNTWNIRAIIAGSNIPVDGDIIRVGTASGQLVFVIGTPTTSWNNSASGKYVNVDEVILSHNNANNASWTSNWSISRNVTDLTGYTLHTVPTTVFASVSYVDSKFVSGTINSPGGVLAPQSETPLGVFTVAGINVGDPILIGTSTYSGVIYKAYAMATNTLSFSAVNVTTSSINLPAEVIKVQSFKI